MEKIDEVIIPIEADLSGFSSALGDLEKQSKRFGTAFSGTIKGAITNGKSFEDTLKSLALRMSNIALSAGLKPLENATSSLVNNLFGSIGNSFSSASAGLGNVTPFANGGIVTAPTLFGTGNQTGLMGEAGAEAILPLARNANGKLGVQVQGGAASTTHVTFNISTPDVEGFRKSQNQISALLARTVERGRRSL